MTYFLIAGEASGDLHAGNLIHALKEKDKAAHFIGLGGDKMQQAGCRLVQHYRNMAFMGVISVLANLRKVLQNFRIAKQTLLQTQPDVLILIDYPSFNLKMAQFCKKHLPDTRIVYYIPPKVWAWKKWRIHKIAQLSDLILGIFPFEPDFYAKYGYQCHYVGNPTMDSITEFEKTYQPAKKENTNLIAILPGSRRSEISHCLPPMLTAARHIKERLKQDGKQCLITVTAAPGIEDRFYQSFITDEQLTRNTYQTVSEATAAIVNSGTATLETALLRCPQTAVYYVALSRYLGFLKPLIFSIPFFTLVNIIPGKEVIQELVAYRFNVKEIEKETLRLLSDNTYRLNMLAQYEHIRQLLGTNPAADTAAEMILQKFKSPK